MASGAVQCRTSSVDYSPHILDVPSAAFQDTNGNSDHGQQHHISHVETFFEIENERGASPKQDRHDEQQQKPQNLHTASSRTRTHTTDLALRVIGESLNDAYIGEDFDKTLEQPRLRQIRRNGKYQW